VRGVRSAIYVDDGQVLGKKKEEAEAAMRLTLQVFQLAGWNVQWKKTELTARQEVKYLGVRLDLASLQYRAVPGKQQQAKVQAADLRHRASRGEKIGAWHLAQWLGRLAALRLSHGSVVQIATRKLQNHLGRIVQEEGWDGEVEVNRQEAKELRWVEDNLCKFDGRGMRNERGQEEIVTLEAVRQLVETKKGGAWTAVVEGRAQVQCWTVRESGQLEESWEYPGGASRHEVLEGIKELMCIAEKLSQKHRQGEEKAWSRLVWVTSSRHCYNQLHRGATYGKARELLLEIKELEKRSHTMV
jgi:hypothetical protein